MYRMMDVCLSIHNDAAGVWALTENNCRGCFHAVMHTPWACVDFKAENEASVQKNKKYHNPSLPKLIPDVWCVQRRER